MNHDLYISNLEKTKDSLTGVIAQHYLNTMSEALRGYRNLLANMRSNGNESKDRVISTLNQRCANYEREIAGLRKQLADTTTVRPKETKDQDKTEDRFVIVFWGVEVWRILDRKKEETLDLDFNNRKKAENLVKMLNDNTNWDTEVKVDKYGVHSYSPCIAVNLGEVKIWE